MEMDKFANKKVGIMGGAFNPFHVGHLRHAIEIAEELDLEAVDLLVSYNHPQKEGLLPFELRLQCIEKSICGLDFIHINRIEENISGPSYTDIILTEWKKNHPDAIPYFLMGIEDFKALSTWHNGLTLHTLANLIVVARLGKTAQDFYQIAKNHWDTCIIEEENSSLPLAKQKKVKLFLDDSCICTFINIPTLNIDATSIRKLWSNQRNIKGLVHDEVIKFLAENKEIVKKYWN